MLQYSKLLFVYIEYICSTQFWSYYLNEKNNCADSMVSYYINQYRNTQTERRKQTNNLPAPAVYFARGQNPRFYLYVFARGLYVWKYKSQYTRWQCVFTQILLSTYLFYVDLYDKYRQSFTLNRFLVFFLFWHVEFIPVLRKYFSGILICTEWPLRRIYYYLCAHSTNQNNYFFTYVCMRHHKHNSTRTRQYMFLNRGSKL